MKENSAEGSLSTVKYLREIREIDGIPDPDSMDSLAIEMRESILAGDVWIVRNAFENSFLDNVKEYLSNVARNSLPNFQPLKEGTPNFHRMVGPDPRSYVKGKFHQWSFFPWNEDVFDFFEAFSPAYMLNNCINGFDRSAYLGIEPERGCIARVAFQCYPKGIGYINRHQDVAGPHKFTTMTLAMSAKGVDYSSGGTYISQGEEKPDFDMDGILKMGDLTFMYSPLIHGVAPVDPDHNGKWLKLDGKWSCVLAVNKVTETDDVQDSVDLGN